MIKGEKTNGFYRRLLILEMNSIPSKADAKLFEKLSQDIEHYIYLCVNALERLYEQGCILESANSKKAVQRMRCDSDTVQAFLLMECHEDLNGKIERRKLYEAYKKYCDENERQALTSNNFYKSMRSKGFDDLKGKSNGYYYFKKIALNDTLAFPYSHDEEEKNPFI